LNRPVNALTVGLADQLVEGMRLQPRRRGFVVFPLRLEARTPLFDPTVGAAALERRCT
jgi:hypothetical protein